MATPRRILVADPDLATIRALGPALRRRGYQVHVAHDGWRALQLAVLRFPDLVLLDERASLVDARTFVRILRANPRTERIPVVLTGGRDGVERGSLGQYLKKPFDLDEVLARVEQVFRGVDAARAASGDADLGGNLSQIPLVDLLQILAVNRKTGRLELTRQGVRAEIAFAEGRITDAAMGPVVGEKALFRLLSQSEGQFSFIAGKASGEGRIAKRIEDLALEGLRQADETARLLPSSPAPGDLLALAVPPAEIPEGLHPAAAEVVSLLGPPRSLQDLLDRATATDLEVLRALETLLQRGDARREPRPAPSADGAPPLLAAHEVHALRSRVLRAPGGAPATGKLILAGGGPLVRRAALVRFGALPGFTSEAAGAAVAFGTLGSLALGDGVRVDLLALPADPALEPLWRPFSAGAVGALVLLPAEDVAARLGALARALRFPIGVCGPSETSVEPVLRGASGGCSFLGADPAEALRGLLAEICKAG